MKVEASSVVQLPSHSITILRGEPSTLPDIPPPPARVEQAPEVPFPPQRRHFLLGLSVKVYDHSLSHLMWSDPQTKNCFEAWCAWDWSLFAPMLEVANDRVTYSLMFLPLKVETATRDPWGRINTVPEHPQVAADQFVLTKGDAGSPAGIPLLEAFQRYCLANKLQLEQLSAARERYQADAEAWRKANPSQPENHTIWLRPHRGSRYLGNTAAMSPAGESSTGEDAR